jgi:excisionase family DNA binding protein
MPTDTRECEWLAAKEYAAKIRVDISTVYRAVKRGELPALRLSEHGAIRIRRSVLDQHRKEHQP